MRNPFIAMVLVLGSVSAFGSGFKCETINAVPATSVKLFNHINAEDGTRTPAAMVISNEDEGTILVAKGSAIRKHNRANTVQYVVDGNKRLGADSAILQITFKEGREVLEAGEVVRGQLILVDGSDRSVSELDCERYLKNL